MAQNRITLNSFPPNAPLPPPLKTFIRGNGSLELTGDSLRLVNTDTVAGQYTDAQIDDYQVLARRDFLWRSPLQMTVRARFSHPAGELKGTAGFGFWNDPFMMTGWRWPALPRVIWFFYSSPPSNLKLDLNTPGPGWKAGTLDALRWPFFALLPTAPLAVPLMNIGPLYRTFWPIGQKAINVSEALVPAAMTEWHTYAIDWQPKTAHFSVDGQTILGCQTPPKGPLGFVLWIDNQYMVATPRGSFKYGLLTTPGQQWLEVSQLTIEN
ncbi:MAG: family 16 glycosylhydrolase [Anaerolineae bacterium]|nr:family 16 glycosylhydrolase [Anaerolineae bacterium]